MLYQLSFTVQNNIACLAFVLALKTAFRIWKNGMFILVTRSQSVDIGDILWMLLPWILVLTTFLTFGSSDGFGKSPSETNLCFVDPKCCVNCCCELTDNSQMLQYNSVVWLSFEMHSGNGSGNFIFSDAFGRSLFAKRFYIFCSKMTHIFENKDWI